MRLIKNRSRGLYLCFVLLFTFVIGGSVMAHANSGSGTATAIVNAGNVLSESPASTQESLALTSSKKAQTASYTLPITVTDARGSGAGWKLTITSTTFSMTSGKNKNQLPTTASSIKGINQACSATPKSTCTLPTDSITYPLTIPAGTTPPTSVKFFNAGVNSGLGHFLLTMTVNVSIPANTTKGTYTSTVYLTIASGP